MASVEGVGVVGMERCTRFVKQTTFGEPDGPEDEIGNCWAACLATMLGVDIGTVPDALRTEKDADKRWQVYLDFLARFNLRPISWNFEHWNDEQWSDFWEAMGDSLVHVSGKSPRGDWKHGVIYKAGNLFHDPHPSGDGIMKIDSVEFWLSIDPMCSTSETL